MATWYDQMGTPHATQQLAYLANVWDYDPSAWADVERDLQDGYTDLSRRNETTAEFIHRTLGRVIGPECYSPDHFCDDCSPF